MGKDSIFGEYAMEGHTATNDEIYLELNSDMLAAKIGGLKSSHAASVKIKLTNKVMPCLTFEIEAETQHSNTVCIHDIPCTVISRSRWKDYEEPEVPEFDINITLPPIRVVRTALDRVRGCGIRATVSASTEGWVEISMDKFTVKSAVRFKELTVLEFEADKDKSGNDVLKSTKKRNFDTAESDEASQTVAVDVDTKNLYQLISSVEELKPESCLCSVLEDHLLHLYFTCGECTLRYTLPGIG